MEAQIQRLQERMRYLWSSGLEAWTGVAECELSLCKEGEAQKDSRAAAATPEARTLAENRLQALYLQKQRAWENVQAEMKHLIVAIAVLVRQD